MAGPLLLFIIFFVITNGIRYDLRADGSWMSRKIGEKQRTELEEKMRPLHYEIYLETAAERCFHERKDYYAMIGSYKGLWTEKEEFFNHLPNTTEIADRMKERVPSWGEAHEFGCYYDFDEFDAQQKVVCIFAYLERDKKQKSSFKV